MNDCLIIVLASVLISVSGLPLLVRGASRPALQRLSVALHVFGSAIGIIAAFNAAITGGTSTVSIGTLAFWGDVSFLIDRLSALFLIPIFFVTALGAIYEFGYCDTHPSIRPIRVFYGLMCGALSLVLCCAHGAGFLFCWEIMALSAFFLVGIEDKNEEVRKASWIYLASTHCGTLMLFALFSLIQVYSGSFALSPSSLAHITSSQANVLFVLALLGFGFKAGIFPLHFWLPPAHSAAPTHVSAVLSGVLIKVGIYGVLRTIQILPVCPVWWGVTILILGASSSVIGVMYALGQHELKRLLAYHSIENIGIILLGIGVAALGRSLGSPTLVALGFTGGVLHVWNHALFKSLLFLSAGGVIHSTHHRDIDHLGGLLKTMPITGISFLIGAVAISGLPPLNGFISELAVYLSLLQISSGSFALLSVLALLCIVALCFTGALALACFVKVFGCVFLGEPRKAITEVHEASQSMLTAQLILAGACAVIGIFPQLVLYNFERAGWSWAALSGAPTEGLGAHFPFFAVTFLGIALAVLSVLFFRAFGRRVASRSVPTWDCGFAFPTARMQYTSSSFAQMLVGSFRPVVPSRASIPSLPRQRVLPARTEFESHVSDLIFSQVITPAGRALAWASIRARIFQRGISQYYILYILVTFLLFLGLTTVW